MVLIQEGAHEHLPACYLRQGSGAVCTRLARAPDRPAGTTAWSVVRLDLYRFPLVLLITRRFPDLASSVICRGDLACTLG